MKSKNKDTFWPSYVDIMTTLFAIMVVLFGVSYSRFSTNEKALRLKADKMEEIQAIYKAVENIDSSYFEFNKQYVKHIFRIQVTYQVGKSGIFELRQDKTNKAEAEELRKKVLDAGEEIRNTIVQLQNSESSKQDIKYLVVIEGQASADGFSDNDVLSYRRALSLNKFWKSNGIDLANMDNCELLISGSGEQGVPRYSASDYEQSAEYQSRLKRNPLAQIRKSDYEKYNQRFLIHIVPVIGNIKWDD